MILLLPPTSNTADIDKFAKDGKRGQAGVSKSANESIINALKDSCELPPLIKTCGPEGREGWLCSWKDLQTNMLSFSSRICNPALHTLISHFH